MRSTISVIDFGTSKVVAMIAEISGKQRCDITGAGTVEYNGFSNSRWNQANEVNEVITNALQKAEEQARTNAKSVYVGVPGEFCTVLPVEVKVPLQGASPIVTSKDIQALFEAADEKVQDQINGTAIHRSPAWFMVDGGKKSLEPLNKRGSEIQAMICYVVADSFFIEDVRQRLSAIGKPAAGFFSTSMGEAMLYINNVERDNTAFLIDIGYQNTEIMAVEGDAIIYHKVLPLGGGHIAADLAYGLQIKLESAEEIKRSFEYGPSNTKESFTVGQGQTFTHEQVESFLLPRAEEICDQIAECVKESGVRLGTWSQIYLTGGGLVINKGGREFLASKLDHAVREVPNKASKLSSAVYSSALGLLDLIIETKTSVGSAPQGIAGFFKSLFNL